MAKEKGSSQPRTAKTEQTAEHLTKRMANLSPWGSMHHATKHVAAALTHVQKLSQATDLQDRLRIHAEHVKTHVDLFNERAKELSDAVAVASNLIGGVVSHLHWHKHLGDMARNSPTYEQTGKETGGKGRKRNWSAARTQR
jgi:hypothetical protein